MVSSKLKTNCPHPWPRVGCSGPMCRTMWYKAGGASKKNMSQGLL
jgi:hypothetical protein